MKDKYKLWVALSLLIVFGLGVTVGIFSEKTYFNRKKPRPQQRQEPFPTLGVISKELQLTPEQEAQIREIFKRSEERFEAFRKEVHLRVKGLSDQLKTEMDSVLTPKQQKKMQEMMDNYLRQRRKDSSERRNDRPRSQTPPNKGEGR
jgi:Spy/CpxP family protein refolding chaperone